MRSTVHRARNQPEGGPNIPAQGFGRRSCAGRRSRAPRAGLLFFFFHRASASPCGGGSSSDPVHPRGPSTVYEYAASCCCGSAFSQNSGNSFSACGRPKWVSRVYHFRRVCPCCLGAIGSQIGVHDCVRSAAFWHCNLSRGQFFPSWVHRIRRAVAQTRRTQRSQIAPRLDPFSRLPKLEMHAG